MIGQSVFHCRILEEPGGVVYKAKHTKLKLTIAVEFPPELTRDKDARIRLVHEDQAVSATKHNIVCAIHETGDSPFSHGCLLPMAPRETRRTMLSNRRTILEGS
jgi:hypothetical protein